MRDPLQRGQLSIQLPDRPFHVVLVEPDIAPNTGNIARLCAATRSHLHLVEPLGFRLTDANLRRAGLDYWEHVTLSRHKNLQECTEATADSRRWYFSTKAEQSYLDIAFEPGDALFFGSETRGLDETILRQNHDLAYGIPISFEHVRSLNLATSVAIVLFEALRQVAVQ